MSFKHTAIFIVPIASRTDEGGVSGDGSKGRRRQGEKSGGGGKSRKGNSIPLSAVFGALLFIGIGGEVQCNNQLNIFPGL